MLIAAFGIVFHGAFSLTMHPVGSHAHSEAATVALSSGQSHAHHDGATTNAGAHHDHAKHDHGKAKGTVDCCSTVSVVLLPAVYGSKSNVRLTDRFSTPLDMSGEGLPPAEPGKPPRTTYQC